MSAAPTPPLTRFPEGCRNDRIRTCVSQFPKLVGNHYPTFRNPCFFRRREYLRRSQSSRSSPGSPGCLGLAHHRVTARLMPEILGGRATLPFAPTAGALGKHDSVGAVRFELTESYSEDQDFTGPELWPLAYTPMRGPA